jgi:hypothetical protein
MATSSTSVTMAEHLVGDEGWSAIQQLLPPKPPRPFERVSSLWLDLVARS